MKRFALLAACIVVLAGAIVAIHRKHRPMHLASGVATQAPMHPVRPAVTQKTARSRPAPGARASRPRFAIGDKLYDVTSTEHAAWLERNMFPTEQELRSEPAASMRGLTRRDLEGPLTAAMLLRADMAARLQPDLRELALARLNEAAALGSIQALRTLSNLYQDRRHRDFIRAEAYGRVAAMRGDWMPRLTMYRLNDMQSAVAEMRAQALYETLERERQRRGRPPFRRDPPPGLNEAIRKMEVEFDALPADMRKLTSGG